MALKKMIHRQAGIDPVIQELFYENLPYSPRELIPASKLPNTTVGQIVFHSYSTCMHNNILHLHLDMQTLYGIVYQHKHIHVHYKISSTQIRYVTLQ